jgi:hypothetical protein
MKVVGQYSDGTKAIDHAVDLVSGYMEHITDAKKRNKLSSLYAPAIHQTSHAPRALAVFDIDDTLLFDIKSKSVPHKNVIELLRRLHAMGVHIHLVTARLDCKEMRDETLQDLQDMGLSGLYTSVSLAPDSARSSMSAVSRWKMETRLRIANGLSCPVTLTVGDQWGDMVVFEDDEVIDQMDADTGAKFMPYVLVRPSDGVSLWGLKLPAY